MKLISMRVIFVIMLAVLSGSVCAQLLDITKEKLTDKILYDAAFNSSYPQLVVVGEGGLQAASVNKTDTIWVKREEALSYDLRSVAWTGSMFIAVGQRGTIMTSANGISWKESSSGTKYDLYSVAWDEQRKLVIAAGDTGTIITSVDGVTWSTPLNTGIKLRINDITWNGNVTVAIKNRVYVAVGEQGLILTSTNLSTWDSVKVEGVDRVLYSITWTGSEFIAVGENSMSYCACPRSEDGKSWTRTCGECGGGEAALFIRSYRSTV